jgi:hypothetical protein
MYNKEHWKCFVTYGTYKMFLNDIPHVQCTTHNCPPFPQLLLLQSQQGNVVGHHLQHLNVLEGEPLYAIKSSQLKQETFRYEYPLHEVLLPT